MTVWTVAYQTPLSRNFSRKKYWSELPFSSPGGLPNPGTEPRSSALQADSLTPEPPGKPLRFIIINLIVNYMGFPDDASGKEPACPWRRLKGSIPGLRRSPGGGNGNPLQYYCLENPMDRGAWRATVHRAAKRHHKSSLACSNYTVCRHETKNKWMKNQTDNIIL